MSLGEVVPPYKERFRRSRRCLERRFYLNGRMWMLVLLGLLVWTTADAQTCTSAEHDRWVGKALKDMQAIRVGMTRQDVLTVFTQPGGFFYSSRAKGTYAYKKSPYIRIDVEFSPAAGTDASAPENPKDVITAISKPYLAEPAYD